MKYNKYLEEIVTTTPLVLLTIRNLKDISTINDFLPYSTGFEIECMKGNNYNEDNFKGIPDILDVSNDTGEQRYRIPSGIKGFFCLYNICEQLRSNSELNSLSGIHYHIDMTDCFSKVTQSFIDDNKDWILEELDNWNYKGSFNQRSSGFHRCWAKFSLEHKTLEIRIGEMSFDYQVLAKRIMQSNSIVKKIKDKLGITYKSLNPEPLDIKLLDYIKTSSPIRRKTDYLYNKFLSTLEETDERDIESKAEGLDLNDIKNIIKNRNQNKL